MTAVCAYDTTNSDLRYTFKVQVVGSSSQNVPVSTISISPSSKTLNVGDTWSPLTLIGPVNATDSSIDWSSSNTAVATVSKGSITAVAPGTATITATAHDGSGVMASCTVTVNAVKAAAKPVTKAANTLVAKARAKQLLVKFTKLRKAAQTIKKTKAFIVKNAKGTVTFKKASGNKKIAIAKNGTITVKKGLKRGVYPVKVKVTAAGNGNYAKGSKTVSFKVKVK